MDRVSRFINNRKQDKIRVVNAQPSLQSMREGEEVLFFNRKGVLSRYRKERGILWRSDMYKNNDLNVEETLNASNLKYSSTFIDYRYFIHNFSDDINTDTHYVPWQGTGEQASPDNSTSSFLVPYKMTCHKILFRPETLSDATADFEFKIVKQDDGDTTRDTVSTFTYTTTLSSDTLIEINQSDWDNSPTVEAGEKVSIYLDASTDPSGTIDWFITSVWKVTISI